MRRDVFYAIKKIPVRPHRKIFEASATLPYYDSRARVMRIYGNTEYTADGRELQTVGDALGDRDYRIPVRLSGRNLIKSMTFINLLRERVDVTAAIQSGALGVSFPAGEMDTPFITTAEIKFKENTAYTLIGTYDFSRLAQHTDTGLAFVYTDGSYDPITLPEKKALHRYLSHSSDPTKTLSSISVRYSFTAKRLIRFRTTEFAIFEGIRPSGASSFETYVEPVTAEISLRYPLRMLGRTRDTLDIVKGEHIRRIEHEIIGGSASFITVKDGVFAFPLNSFVRADRNMRCSMVMKDYEAILEGEYGAAITPDNALAVRLEGILTGAELLAALAASPIYITYAIETPEVYSVTPPAFDITEERIFSVETSYPPSRVVYEYV